MKHRLSVLPLLAVLGLAGGAHAETLLVDRVKEEPAAALPTRGLSMAQVQARYGAPQQKAGAARRPEAAVADHQPLGLSGLHRVLREAEGGGRGRQQGRRQRDRPEAGDPLRRVARKRPV